jgi:hypothetical protein
MLLNAKPSGLPYSQSVVVDRFPPGTQELRSMPDKATKEKNLFMMEWVEYKAEDWEGWIKI